MANWNEPLQGPLLQERRERWLEKFKVAQAHSPRWVFLDRIVDWYVREPGTGKADTARLKAGYKELTQSLLMREFDHGRGGFVHVLSPDNFYPLPLERLPATIDQGNLRGLAESYPINGDMDQAKGTILIDAYLKWCCVPADLAARWLRNRRVDLPDWLASPGSHARPKTDAAQLQANAWMLAEARAERENGRWLKMRQGIAACYEALKDTSLGCTTRQATRAFSSLPDEMVKRRARTPVVPLVRRG